MSNTYTNYLTTRSKSSNPQLEEILSKIYKTELQKMQDSIKERCEQNSVKGMDQMIGRRFGNFLQEIVRITFELTCKEIQKTGIEISLKDIILDMISNHLKSSKISNQDEILNSLEKEISPFIDMKIGLGDFQFSTPKEQYVVEIKWRVRWNDAKTVKEHAMAAPRIISQGFVPVMLIRRPRNESFSSLDRFEKNGWIVLTGDDCGKFIQEHTNFDLFDWIKNNVNFWNDLKQHHECLKNLQVSKNDFTF